MKRNFRHLIWLLALIVTAAVLLASCSSKKKSLDIQKEHLEQASSVKIEQQQTFSDNSLKVVSENTTTTEEYEQEDSFTADSVKEDAQGNKTFFGVKGNSKKRGNKNKNKGKASNTNKNIQAAQSTAKDSTGTLKQESKHKVQDKEIKESTSGKLYAIGFLILVVLVAVWYIRRQQRRVKEAADLFI